ncbi:hypothetical protein WI0192307A01_CDS0037 [Salmonella phage VT223]
MGSKDELFEYLIDQLRQQVNSNPYKQQCEDLAHEVLSLKNQLRDASEKINGLRKALARATGDVEAYKLLYKSGYRPEQSGCDHDWYRNCLGSYDEVCVKCGMKR